MGAILACLEACRINGEGHFSPSAEILYKGVHQPTNPARRDLVQTISAIFLDVLGRLVLVVLGGVNMLMELGGGGLPTLSILRLV